MLDEIRTFFEEVRAERRTLPLTPHATAEVADIIAKVEHGIELWLVRLYEAGADEPDHIELLDRIMKIIRQRGRGPTARLQEIAGLVAGG